MTSLGQALPDYSAILNEYDFDAPPVPKPSRAQAALEVMDVHRFLALNIPAREILLAPWLTAQSLNMIYGKRGLGKTLLALSISYAVSSCADLLGWKACKPRKVLYVDGEMLAGPLQERLADIVRGSEYEPKPGMLHILTPDLQKGFMPNLATIAGQDALDAVIPEGTDLIVLDSLSSLVRGQVRENDAESWDPLATWMLSQRVAGRSVLFLHHANKSGAQRGTSKKEDLLDTVIALRPPADHQPQNGAKFEIHMEKSRGLCREFVPIEATLAQAPAGGVCWATKPIEQTVRERALQMAADGMSKREIAEELHVNRSTIYRALSGGEGAV
jgi:hypothetical protein